MFRHSRFAFTGNAPSAAQGRATVVGGFTLIELMTVVAIIAILAGFIIGVSGYAMRKASVSHAIADMEKIKNALERYRAEFGTYPTNTAADNSKNWVSVLWHERQFLVFKGWNDTGIIYQALDPWDKDYRYYHDAEGAKPGHVYATNNNSKFGYDLWSEGPTTNADDDINNWGSASF